jgi:alkylhydroperoxidase/carboxymuconolactone decarboxylase family protein YurZ
MDGVRRAFEWLQDVPAGGGRKPVVRPYDYGFVGEMSVLMNAHPRIGPALTELFMQVMFAPGALARSGREMIAAVAAAAQDCHY